MIELTHHLATFLAPVYQKLKKEVLASKLLHADETPHNMLEGEDTKHWYLWGFFSVVACFFEVHNNRAAKVAFDFLKNSIAEFLVTDAYSAYSSAVNSIKMEFNRVIIEINCNAHAVRYFKDAAKNWKEAEEILSIYDKIFKIEKKRKEGQFVLTPEKQLEMRAEMAPLFKQIKGLCEEANKTPTRHSSLVKAVNYFLNQYEELSYCCNDIRIPLENNLAERELRPHVVGRKTWYGTHSKRGAETAAVHFSIIRSCMINGVNPRFYYDWIAKRIHQGQEVLTPFEFLKLFENSGGLNKPLIDGGSFKEESELGLGHHDIIPVIRVKRTESALV
jgi:hypothetical protein